MQSSMILMIIGIFVGVALINALIWIPILRRMRRLPEVVREELTAAGEKIVHGPARGQYRGATGGDYPHVNGVGVLVLTRDKLVFKKAIGRRIDVPIEEVVGIREDKWFHNTARLGVMHLIVQLLSGAEVGYLVEDHEGWKAALRKATGKPLAARQASAGMTSTP